MNKMMQKFLYKSNDFRLYIDDTKEDDFSSAKTSIEKLNCRFCKELPTDPRMTRCCKKPVCLECAEFWRLVVCRLCLVRSDSAGQLDNVSKSYQQKFEAVKLDCLKKKIQATEVTHLKEKILAAENELSVRKFERRSDYLKFNCRR